MVSWIRRQLPAGTAEAFSASELAACAARQPAPFHPYDPD